MGSVAFAEQAKFNSSGRAAGQGDRDVDQVETNRPFQMARMTANLGAGGVERLG
jgi:hypothetical protein